LLYALGIILTFNMGRDITFIVTYPFFFGYALVYWMERKRGATVGRRQENGSQRVEVGDQRVGTSVVRETGVSVRKGEAGAETVDQRRDVGTGGTVRSLPTRTPKRIARWMPRRIRAAVAAQSLAEEAASEELEIGGQPEAKPEMGRRGDQMTETSGQSSEARQRPRQLGLPFQNYRRYRG
jgi:hypothetical protein